MPTHFCSDQRDKMHNIKIINCVWSSRLWDRVIQMVGTDDMAWIYYFHYLMACMDRHNAPPKHNQVHTRLYAVLTQTTL